MIVARAPYRISLGGGGTDLPSYYSRYGAFVVSAAINKYLYVCLNRPQADNCIHLKYSRYERAASVDEIEHDLVRPALKLLAMTDTLEISSMADVPSGTGLGSSGTYLVALLTALYDAKRMRIPTQALAEQACHIEMDLAGHPVGKHDHYLAAFGGITSLEIARDGAVRVSPVNLDLGTLEEFRNCVSLFYTNVTRSSREILRRQAQDTERADPAVLASMHRTRELGYEIRRVLERGELRRFGELLDEHWRNKRTRCEAISDARIDAWYECARANGALGGKVMGAGGGGFFMFYAPAERKADLRQALGAAGLREMPYDFDFEGAKVVVNF